MSDWQRVVPRAIVGRCSNVEVGADAVIVCNDTREVPATRRRDGIDGPGLGVCRVVVGHGAGQIRWVSRECFE